MLTSWARFRPSRIELPDDERVALSLGAQAAVESRPVVADAGGEVVVEVGRVVDARSPEGVALQVQRLGAVGLRDAGVADQHVSQTNVLGHEDAGGFPASACMPLRPAQSSPRPARPGCTRRTRAHESWPLLDPRAPPFRKKTVTSKCSCRFLLVVLPMPSCRFSQDSCELIRTRPARHR